MEQADNVSAQKTKKKKPAVWKSALVAMMIPIGLIVVIVNFKYPLGLIGFNYEYSEGVRVGRVVKVSERGVIWKTFEVSLGVTQSGAYIEKWDFSVDSADAGGEQLKQALLAAARSGQLVEVKYSQRIGALPWRSKTSYLAEEVTPLSE
jgi:hypothetical protein